MQNILDQKETRVNILLQRLKNIEKDNLKLRHEKEFLINQNYLSPYDQ